VCQYLLDILIQLLKSLKIPFGKVVLPATRTLSIRWATQCVGPGGDPRESRIGPILADKYGAVTLKDGEMLGFMYEHRCDLGERWVTSRVLGPAVFFDGVFEIDLDKITTSGFLEIFLFFLLQFISSIKHRVITPLST